jgi:hypothetical protein
MGPQSSIVAYEARCHRRRRRGGSGVAVVVVVALAASGCGGAGGPASPSTTRRPAGTTSSVTSVVPRPTCTPHPPRRGRLPGRTRVLFMGDSVMGNIYVDGDARGLFERNGYEVQRSATPGYGLLDDPPHGYTREMARRVLTFDPDIVVLEFIGSYRAFNDPGLPGVDLGTPTFYATWQQEAESVTRQAIVRGAEVYWVLGPSVGISQQWFELVHGIATGYLELSTRLCETHHVDAFAVLGDPWAPGPLRTPEGVHLTAEGGAVLARAICDRIVAESKAATRPCS